jgi:hypothetical protein
MPEMAYKGKVIQYEDLSLLVECEVVLQRTRRDAYLE